MDKQRLEEIASEAGMSFNEAQKNQLDDEPHEGKTNLRRNRNRKWLRRGLISLGAAASLLYSCSFCNINTLENSKGKRAVYERSNVLPMWAVQSSKRGLHTTIFFSERAYHLGLFYKNGPKGLDAVEGTLSWDESNKKYTINWTQDFNTFKKRH